MDRLGGKNPSLAFWRVHSSEVAINGNVDSSPGFLGFITMVTMSSFKSAKYLSSSSCDLNSLICIVCSGSIIFENSKNVRLSGEGAKFACL